ncbi:TAXI family TRAP transporter solute-binding subunit [Synergistaceae bacterium OttesenSCG-928-D05]|nr:TAXI family TRAP transporter solute-binding subunit [Synergistaceae bacterium OttesenSCG-928-D05]
MIKKKSFLILLLFLLGIAAGCAWAAPSADTPKQLTLLAGSPGSNWTTMGSAISSVWAKEVLPTNCLMGGAVSNLTDIKNGKGDIGITYVPFLESMRRGNTDRSSSKTDDVVVMTNLFEQYICFIARKDFVERNRIFLLSDLFDKKLPVRMATLKPGTGVESVLRSLLKECYNVTYDSIKSAGGRVEYTSYEAGMEMLVEGHVDIFVLVLGKNVAALRQLDGLVDYEILQIDNSSLRSLARDYGTTTAVLNPSMHAGISIPIRTVGLPICLAVRKSLPDDIVYELCKTLWQYKGEIELVAKDVEELSPETALPETVAAHPGAVKFWNEHKEK